MRRLFRVLLLLLASLVWLLIAARAALERPRPETGETGAAADALARDVAASVRGDAWDRTMAVSFRFAGRNEHLWDREAGLSRVRWEDVEVLQHLDRREGIVREGGMVVVGARRAELLEDAWGRFCNDTFWLNPLVKLFDDGVERSIVQVDGRHALLVEYASGGVTPGDAYLWLLGDDQRPTAWRMWVSILPVGGVEASWEGWQTLSTGAVVATQHRIGPVTVELHDVRGATTLAELEDDDAFAELR